MSIEFDSKIESYIQGFNEFKKSDGLNTDYIKQLRKTAINNFSELGFPTLRDEDWRFTNLAPISKSKFKISENGSEGVSSKNVEKFLFNKLDSYNLVFINGKYSKDLSNLENIQDKVKISSLSEAANSNNKIFSEYFGKFLNIDTEAFNALNTAFFQDGLFVYVPKSTALDKPIHAIYISNSVDQTVLNPRNLIIAEDNSELKIIEHYVSLSEFVYFSNVVSEIFIGENSNLEHYMLEFESKKSYNISTLRVEQKRNSNLNSHSVLLGGALVRNNVHPVLNGEGCNSLINGLYMSNDRQHMDNFMRVEHASPHCDSRQFYSGVLDDKSRGVFHGRIIVHEGAEKTDAKQTNRNLLLSDTAQIDTKPQLEIYNDDVKCTHGATIGQMDDEAIFYLQSRGISRKNAQAIMLKGFTGESFASMSIEPVGSYLEKVTNDWFENRGSNNG
ncbi:MAG: Fe-S cluster assembly protein SufD [Thermodesulfobacteriota bacterium]